MDRVEHNNIDKEVKKSFMEYAMSVIVARALPDVRDGLKPVHRRIVYSMLESGYTPDKQHRKCARIVGDVMGKYHPHGDSSIYEAMVRMAQDFSYRYMLVDGHGNFGNMDGDGAAAMRYTEARMSKISMELVRDINKDTVDFDPNFDETEKEPHVLPSRFPNILVNGTMGIAVGMATNIPPHNLGEVIDGCIAYIDNKEITSLELMEYIKGPDFPTGGIILGNSGIRKAYEAGRGTITIRCRAEIDEEHGKSRIVITEVPYGLNTLELKNRIAELVRDKVLDGIADYHEETGVAQGVKIVVTLKREANPNVVLNNLYKHTQLQTTFGINFLMLDQGVPKTLNMREIIEKYIEFQKEVIIRRTKFDLKKAEARAHILNGYKIALDHLDDVIKIIRESKSDVDAKEKLIASYQFTEIQADAILELKLRRLTALERDKIDNELKEILALIEEYNSILGSEERIYGVIKQELLEIKQKYSDERRTNIDMSAIDYIEDESLIPVEDIIVTLTNKGYIKRINSETYRSQNRGGVGIKGMATNEEDFVEQMISLTTHDYLMFFTNKGKVYRMKGYEIPLFSRQSKGLPIINLLQIEKEEYVKAILKVSKDDSAKYLIFCTLNGIVKKTELSEFENIRNSGKIAISLRDNDQLLAVKLADSENEILIASSNGRMIRFNENELRSMGRTASGVKGIDVNNGICVGCEVAHIGEEVLVVTENGYGKRTNIEEYRMTHRGSKGVKALNITEKNGNIVAFKAVKEDKDLMIITNNGVIIRLPLEQISKSGRVAQGVKLINLKDEQKVSNIAIVEKEENIIEEQSNEE
ncbi:MAG: DNA gyrase subunit A [Bacilli bacterium]|nr:DNA gyrase subunit A [Bacilli bacterium]